MIALLRIATLILSFVFASSALAQTTVTLQDGLNGYAGTTDTHSFSSVPGGNFGNRTDWALGLAPTHYMPLMRFAIFAREGGPVPDGATISSATLTLNKTAGGNQVVELRRLLRSWNELQATWDVAATGASWQLPGAQGANDIAATAEGQGTIGDAAGAYDIDVTVSVQAFAAGAPNFGWRFGQVSGTQDNKTYVARENASVTLRPKLTITYNISSCAPGPFNGTPAQVPGTIEAENFDCGGEGAAYHDNTPGNQSTSTYRNPESVDVMDITTGGRTVQFFDTGEWLKYTINVATGGTYDLAINAASNQVPAGQTAGQYRIELDGVDVTGNVNVPSTGSWDAYQWVTGRTSLPLTAGTHTLKLFSVQQSYRVNQLRVTAGNCSSGPFNGTPAQAPGTFEAENFNCGGEGVGYHDNTPGNQSTSQYRPTESVDIHDQSNGLRTVQFFDTGEWMAYTINVATSGSYILGISAAKGASGGSAGLFRIEIDGVNVTGDVPVPTTPDWETPQWVDAPNAVSINAGIHTLKLFSVQQSYRVHQLRLARVETPGPSAQLAVTPASGTTPLNVTFNASGSTPGSAPIASLRLTFGDSAPAVTWTDKNQTQSHSYNTAGTYTATLTVTDANGATSSNSKTITVTPPDGPTAQLTATPSSGPQPLSVTFSAAGSTQGSAPITSLRLQFGHNLQEVTWTDKNVTQSHSYPAGTYTATLTVTDANGLSHSNSRAIQVGTSGRSCHPGADLCVNFEDTLFNTPLPTSQGQIPHITTTSKGTSLVITSSGTTDLVWTVENKGRCSDINFDECRNRLHLEAGRDGGSALWIATLHDDRGVQSCLEAGCQERSEIYITNADTRAGPSNVPQWWAHSVYFPAGSVIEPQGTSILQFHPGQDSITCVGAPCSAPNFILGIQREEGSNPTRMIFRAFSAGTSATDSTGVGDGIHGQYNYFANGFRRTGQCLSADYIKDEGAWYDFVHRIKWSYTNDGSHEIWMRKAGTPVKKVLHRTGINTLYLDGSAELKLGAYHRHVDGTTSLVADRIRRSSLTGAAGADAVRMPDFPVDLNASVTNPDGTLVLCPPSRP